MKTEQILLALEISRCGSVSKAASNLFMAQPNASNSLALLEQELGYQIFERTYNGMKVTSRGRRFCSMHTPLSGICRKCTGSGSRRRGSGFP